MNSSWFHIGLLILPIVSAVAWMYRRMRRGVSVKQRSRNVYRNGRTVVRQRGGYGSNMSGGDQLTINGKPVFTDQQLRESFADVLEGFGGGASRSYRGGVCSTTGVETLKVTPGQVSLHPDDGLAKGTVIVEGGQDVRLEDKHNDGNATLTVRKGGTVVHYGPGVTIRY